MDELIHDSNVLQSFTGIQTDKTLEYIFILIDFRQTQKKTSSNEQKAVYMKLYLGRFKPTAYFIKVIAILLKKPSNIIKFCFSIASSKFDLVQLN